MGARTIETSLRSLITAGLLIAGCDGITDPMTFSGTLEITEHAVGATAPGRLTTLLVDEGDAVSRGQLLATMERYEQAQHDYDRMTKLVAEGGASQQAAEQAALALDDQRIISPVDGVVLIKVRELGETLPAGSPVLVIGDRARLWARIYVPEGIVSRVRIGQPATLRFDGITQTFAGHVSFVSPRAEFTPRNVQTPDERATQTFAVKVALDDAKPWLRPGVAADVTLRSAPAP